MSKGARGVRYGEVDRETKETRVHVVLDLDGGTKQDIETGLPFFDHMLELLAFHGRFDLGIEAEGDLDVDEHHLVEDVGIVLGKALREALSGADPVARYGSNCTPMDEAIILTAIDFSGRGHYYPEVRFGSERVGGLSAQTVPEFFRSFALHAGLTLHQRVLAGVNDHHVCEAMFKGLGRALFEATRIIDRRSGTSTKGKID